jgi:serine/threonine-protein kinase
LEKRAAPFDKSPVSRPEEPASVPPSEADSKRNAAARSSPAPSLATLLGNGPGDSFKQASTPGVLAPGSKFGVYLVGQCIGEGGMARIYQAEHAGLRRQVALKVLIDGFARDPEGRERFLREARIAAAIKHPNVVNIFDVGVHEDIPYLVMELLEGKDLEKLLEPRRPLDEAMIIDIMVPVVAGLTAVHDAGIVHRDLKPGNIFLARGRYNDLEPKLLDFGISKAPGPEQLRLTTNRTLMGTPFYISPEGLRGGEMTPLSDQYSLGVVMYECATGVTPFTASTFAELSKLIPAGQYTAPSVHNPELSKRLARIIEKAMSLEPENRFKDLREMGRELLQLAGQRTRITWGLSFGDVKNTLPSTPSSNSHGARSSPASPPAGRPRRNAGLLLLAAVVPLLALVAGLYAWMSGRAALDTNAPQAVVGNSNMRVDNEPTAAAPSERANPPPTVINPPPAGRADNDREPVIPAAIDKPAPRSRDTRQARPGSRPGVQAKLRPAQATVPAPTESDQPEWALPPASAAPPPNKTREIGWPIIGANGAPIFD